eukprot:2847018-Alexandrium_andersonii.AAC.1
MSASLVGSEMCIRDSQSPARRRPGHRSQGQAAHRREEGLTRDPRRRSSPRSTCPRWGANRPYSANRRR